MAKSTGAKNNAVSKELKAAAKKAKKAAAKERRTQIWQAFNLQRKEDKALLPWMIGVFVASVLVAVGLGLWIGGLPFWIIAGVLLGVLLAFIVFGRRVQKSVFTKADGQAGAGAWVLENMKGQWRVTNGVAGTAQLDVVHRVIGRPGIIFVGEGNPGRLRGLLAQEKKRTSRLVGDTPIYDVIIGNDEGQTKLKDLQKFIVKLPNNIDAKKMDLLEGRLSALAARGGPALPKGPIPGGGKMRGGMQRTIRRR